MAVPEYDIDFYKVYLNLIANDFKDNVILLSSPDFYDLYVHYSFFNNCFSQGSGCAINALIRNCIVKNSCANECTSEVSQEPGGALFFIYHQNSVDYNITLNAISYINTPNNLNTYSSISVYNGTMNINTINSTKNYALSNSLLYVRCYYSQNAFGKFINGVECTCQHEMFFNSVGTYNFYYVNIINCSSNNQDNGIIRSWGDTTFYNSIFLNNIGNLFIAVSSTTKISLNQCFFHNIDVIGSGQVITGDSIDSSETINIDFVECTIPLVCSFLLKQSSYILNKFTAVTLFTIS